MKTSIELIAEERQRQIEEEGWTAEHDDHHPDGELALAACCYAAPVQLYEAQHQFVNRIVFFDPFPFEEKWDKRYQYGECRSNPGNVLPDPKTYTDDEKLDLLAKSGALIAAEMDKILRRRTK